MELSLERHKFSSLITNYEVEQFLAIYKEVTNPVITSTQNRLSPDITSEIDWIVHVLEQNVFLGSSHLTGLLTYAAYKHFATEQPTDVSGRMAMTLGWCMEILDASRVVHDDIIDQTFTRKSDFGTVLHSWHATKEVGMNAVNDSLLLSKLHFRTLGHFFGEELCYQKIYNYSNAACWKNMCGKSLANLTTQGGDLRQALTMDRYSQIVKRKIGSWLALPVTAAIFLAGRGEDQELLEKVESILIKLAQYRQIHNDFHYVFPVEHKIAPTTSNNLLRQALQNLVTTLGKSSWLLVQAAECQLISAETFQFLVDNLCTSDSNIRRKVKSIFEGIQIADSFKEFQKTDYKKIVESIKISCSGEDDKISKFFTSLLNNIQ